MATTDAVLALLQGRRGEMLSGQQAADALGVSRAAVWKAVKALQRQGFRVEALPGGGYRLPAGDDVLSREAVALFLPQKDTPLVVLEECDSTNLEAKRRAVDGAPHGTLVVAARQQAGRGRMGRSFASPPGGLYMSVVLRPEAGAGEAVLVTAAAAVAVCGAVSALCGRELSIKWVNDLFLDGKKCCGILSEGAAGFESGQIEYIVVGIGVNHTTPADAFPPELRDTVTSLFPEGGAPVSRARLAADIHTRLLAQFARLGAGGFMEEYRRRNLVLGRPVTVMAQPPYAAVAESIDEQAHLIVRTPGGERIALSSGEISVKL